MPTDTLRVFIEAAVVTAMTAVANVVGRVRTTAGGWVPIRPSLRHATRRSGREPRSLPAERVHPNRSDLLVRTAADPSDGLANGLVVSGGLRAMVVEWRGEIRGFRTPDPLLGRRVHNQLTFTPPKPILARPCGYP